MNRKKNIVAENNNMADGNGNIEKSIEALRATIQSLLDSRKGSERIAPAIAELQTQVRGQAEEIKKLREHNEEDAKARTLFLKAYEDIEKNKIEIRRIWKTIWSGPAALAAGSYLVLKIYQLLTQLKILEG